MNNKENINDKNMICYHDGEKLVKLELPGLDNIEFRNGGVFAKSSIPKDTPIAFAGGLRCLAEDIVDAFGALLLPKNRAIDTREYGNVTRFIRQAAKGNVTQKIRGMKINGVEIKIDGARLMWICFVASKDISKGQELLLNKPKLILPSTTSNARVEIVLKSGQSFKCLEQALPVPKVCPLVLLKSLVANCLQTEGELVLTEQQDGALLMLGKEVELNNGQEVFVFSDKAWAAFEAADGKVKMSESSRRKAVSDDVREVSEYQFLQELRQVMMESVKEGSHIHRQRLKERAALFGLQENRSIDTEGDCQFDAAADQLRRMAGLGEESKESVRQAAVTWIRQNAERDLGNGMTLRQWIEETNVNFEEYVEDMKEHGCWGDEITLLAIREAYKVSMVLLSSTEGRQWHTTHYPRDRGVEEDELPQLWLGHELEVHYWSLVERDVVQDRIVTFYTHKGGVGKTTLMMNLLVKASKTKRIAAIDCDPQMNATYFLFNYSRDVPLTFKEMYDKMSTNHTLLSRQNRTAQEDEKIRQYEAEIAPKNIFNILMGTNMKEGEGEHQTWEALGEDLGVSISPGIQLFCSHPMLFEFERQLMTEVQSNFQTKNYSRRLLLFCKFLLEKQGYDAVFLDLGPSSSLFNQITLVQSSYLVLPSSADEFAHYAIRTIGLWFQSWRTEYRAIITNPKLVSVVYNKYKVAAGSKTDPLRFNGQEHRVSRAHMNYVKKFQEAIRELQANEALSFLFLKNINYAELPLIRDGLSGVARLQYHYKTTFDSLAGLSVPENEKKTIRGMQNEIMVIWNTLCQIFEWDEEEVGEEDEEEQWSSSINSPSGGETKRGKGISADLGGFFEAGDVMIYGNFECECKVDMMFQIKKRSSKRSDCLKRAFLDTLKLIGVDTDPKSGEWKHVTVRKADETTTLHRLWKEHTEPKRKSGNKGERKRERQDEPSDVEDMFFPEEEQNEEEEEEEMDQVFSPLKKKTLSRKKK